MHDPLTVAFEIYLGKKKKKDGNYRSPFITIWHKDPCKDGTDDSCGWFMRARHGDKNILTEIEREFKFNLDNNYWFDKNGSQVFSTPGTLTLMYHHAAWIYFKYDRRKHNKFMRKHMFDIVYSAENPHDCIGDAITNKWGYTNQKERFDGLAEIIYADILRMNRKWYQHPKWHFWHWEFQFNFFQGFWKKYFKKCDVCKKRGFGTTYGYSDWNGTKSWCEKCEYEKQKEECPIL